MNGGGASDEFFDLRGCAPLGQIGSHLLVGMVPADPIFHQAFQVRQGAMAIRPLNTERARVWPKHPDTGSWQAMNPVLPSGRSQIIKRRKFGEAPCSAALARCSLDAEYMSKPPTQRGVCICGRERSGDVPAMVASIAAVAPRRRR